MYCWAWSPRYTPEALLREAATRLQDRFLFGSAYPFITPQRWLKDFEALKRPYDKISSDVSQRASRVQSDSS